jgi:hypothetical protein
MIGTITKNEISVKDVAPLSQGVTPMRMLLVAALASRAENQDPTDLAFLRGYAEKLLEPGTPRPAPHSPRTLSGANLAIAAAPELSLPPSLMSVPKGATHGHGHGHPGHEHEHGHDGNNNGNNNGGNENANIAIDMNDNDEPPSIPLPPLDALPVSSHDVYADMHGGIPKRQLSMLSTAAAALAEYR